MKTLILGTIMAVAIFAAPDIADAQAAIYHDRAPAGENDKILGQLFLDSLTEHLK